MPRGRVGFLVQEGRPGNCLIRHFQSARTAAAPTPAQQKAREWLPDAMLFPAIDADAPVDTDTDDIVADDDHGGDDDGDGNE